jgi:hypothetical protein
VHDKQEFAEATTGKDLLFFPSHFGVTTMLRKLLFTTALTTTVGLAMLSPASADVVLQTQLSGTGDNVVFDSLTGSTAVGSFNGQHQGLVDFTDLSGNANFVGAANGNDIKISNTSNLLVQVFANDGVSALATATDVFSLKGTGDVTAFVTANEVGGGTKLFSFDLGAIDPNAQSGFTLTAINGETIGQFRLADLGGTIADFEHYRIDIAPTAAVPELSTWGMMLLGFCTVGLLGYRKKANGTLRFV